MRERSIIWWGWLIHRAVHLLKYMYCSVLLGQDREVLCLNHFVCFLVINIDTVEPRNCVRGHGMMDEISLSYLLLLCWFIVLHFWGSLAAPDLFRTWRIQLTWPGSIALTTKKSLPSALPFLFRSPGASRRVIKAIQRSAGSSPLGFVSKRFAFISLRGQCFPQTLYWWGLTSASLLCSRAKPQLGDAEQFLPAE